MFQFNQIPANIQRKLFKRMNALSREGKDYAPLNPMSEKKVNALSEMLTKSCWVKVTAALPQYKKDKDDKFIRKLEKTGHEPFHLSSGFFSLAFLTNSGVVFVDGSTCPLNKVLPIEVNSVVQSNAPFASILY